MNVKDNSHNQQRRLKYIFNRMCSPAVNQLTPHKALFTVRSHTTIVPFSSTITTSSAKFHSDGL
ncbi:hypothetical protein BFJ71_g8254 [Fusarium oxysporum]|uniref:Uncharacterized protein n=1 Tax=Fusarium oxysporum f. sp. cepae TaxID=396571 RepID=A0A3L6P3T4_FUSOX|nr:hypothetical protein BFJ65_g482 [Fusarium oxysporum f. sp. cepae]RKK60832.1 hypothetical protein BFJ67_g2008 [Fusarium oxysporum f. sp. cepae]RKK95788.1 hypothetical protein BFJ71_g8254 [Fusarium oxysporum]